MTGKLRRVAAFGLLTATLFAVPGVLDAEIITFETVARSGDAIPETAGLTYTRFGSPSIAGGTVLFAGTDQVNVWGVYTSSGGTLNRLADTSMAIPGGTGNFTTISGASTDGSTVLFTGVGSNNQSGAYAVPLSGGATTRVVDTTTPVSTGSIQTVLSTDINGGTTAFRANLGPGQEGVYTLDGGSTTTIADFTTLAPDTTSTFRRFSAPVVAADGTVVFRGDTGTTADSFQGIYTGTGGALTTIADSNTAIPNSTESFNQLRTPSIADDGTIAFGGAGSADSGIFTSKDGVLSVIADSKTILEDGTALLAFGAGLSPIWENVVAFVAYDFAPSGVFREALYISRAGSILRVLNIATSVVGSNVWIGEPFDGRQLSLVLLGHDAIEGDTLAFTAAFTDGSFGVYTADISVAAVPEPSSLVLLGLTGVGCAGAFLRRRRTTLRQSA